jgi:putative membrane protein
MLFSRTCNLAAAILLATLTATAQAADKPSDAQIAHITYTAGDIDVKAAKVALEKSKDESVRAFANNMVTDHTAVNDKALALVKKLGVTPEDNDTSKSLVKHDAEKQAELAKLSGSAFDKAYIDNEVAFHKTVLTALDKTLIPSAQNPELKSLLQTGFKIFQGHEQHAEQLAASLK